MSGTRLQNRPNFLGIGAQRTATTWLSEVLRSHPEIYMTHTKEVHYFSKHYERGEGWYISHFRRSNKLQSVVNPQLLISIRRLFQPGSAPLIHL